MKRRARAVASDVSCAAELAASSWETMQAEAAAYEEHMLSEWRIALEELLAAESEDFHAPGVEAGVRLMVAKVALERIERRLGK